jgi:predicted nucleic acid-binding protein
MTPERIGESCKREGREREKSSPTAIAATAALRNLPLATGNVKDFPMPALRVEQWPPPPV